MTRLIPRLFAPTIAGLACSAAAPCLRAQPIQSGDIVIGANYLDQFYSWDGRFYRLRGNDLSVLFDTGTSGVGFAFPSDVFFDSSGRIIFSTGGCGSNENNAAIDRYDPSTGTLINLACIPYIVGAGGPPPGMPTDADGFVNFAGLHLTRTLRITIDDDVNGGVPQVGFADAYEFSVGVHRPSQGNQYEPQAFRFVPDATGGGAIEPGVSLSLLGYGGGGALMAAGPSGTYYSNGSKVGLAGPDLSINLNAHTTVGGVPISVQGTLHVQTQNQILFDGDILDNTVIPNGTGSCPINGQQVTDHNVPYNEGGNFNVLGISALGVLDGSLVASSSSVSTGVPWMFNLERRDPFLNPYICLYYNCVEHYGPYHFFQDPPPLSNFSIQQGRILGGDDNGGRVFSVSPSGFQVLASGLGRPRGAAAYPPETPPLTAGALVVRIDSPLNVLVTDAQGRRIGYAADGTLINDFGGSGAMLALGPEGHPRIYCIAAPAAGNYSLQMVGTGDGPYTVSAYAAETSTGGALDTITGIAHPGSFESRTLGLHLPIGVRFAPSCYPNCDRSTVAPVLNVLDFACFLNSFAAGDPYANCDGSTTTPVLNVLDFACFLNSFAAGCN